MLRRATSRRCCACGTPVADRIRIRWLQPGPFRMLAGPAGLEQVVRLEVLQAVRRDAGLQQQIVGHVVRLRVRECGLDQRLLLRDPAEHLARDLVGERRRRRAVVHEVEPHRQNAERRGFVRGVVVDAPRVPAARSRTAPAASRSASRRRRAHRRRRSRGAASPAVCRAAGSRGRGWQALSPAAPDPSCVRCRRVRGGARRPEARISFSGVRWITQSSARRDRLLVALQLRQLLVEGGELALDLRESGCRRIRVLDEIRCEMCDRSLRAGLRQLGRDRAGDGALRLRRPRRGARDDAEHGPRAERAGDEASRRFLRRFGIQRSANVAAKRGGYLTRLRGLQLALQPAQLPRARP